VYRIGVTSAVREDLGHIGFIDLPAEPGQVLLPGRPFAMVEGPNGRAILESPLQGEVVDVNLALLDAPASLDADPEGGEAWLIELDGLLEEGEIDEHWEAMEKRLE
jgi:glycine cleavage system H protein